MALARPIIGLLISNTTQFHPFTRISRSKNILKIAYLVVDQGQLLDTLLSYQGVPGLNQCKREGTTSERYVQFDGNRVRGRLKELGLYRVEGICLQPCDFNHL